MSKNRITAKQSELAGLQRTLTEMGIACDSLRGSAYDSMADAMNHMEARAIRLSAEIARLQAKQPVGVA